MTIKVFLSIPCPTCGVAIGQNCLRHSGGLRAEPHLDRKLVAAEALETKNIRHGTIPNTPK